ncbi:hypothetical protein ACFQS7_06365 [Dankookia sp. GCM10030260]|uniref:hypothetical protein n=1 Tax=Dankookia sp. GCM10030260 TaxID=3273390 RepID=UPI00361A1C1C
MDTDRKHDQTMVMDRPGLRRGPAAAPVPPRPMPEAPREAVFDIADFEAIASFAGLPARPRQAG